MNLTFVDSKDIGYRFGWCRANGDILISNDLPFIVKRFVLDHELYHRSDRGNWIGKKGIRSFIRKEFLANYHAAKSYPFGFICTAALRVYRILVRLVRRDR